jgi:hypothetical protein
MTTKQSQPPEPSGARCDQERRGLQFEARLPSAQRPELCGLASISSILSRIRRYRTILNKSAGDPYPRAPLSSVGEVAKSLWPTTPQALRRVARG